MSSRNDRFIQDRLYSPHQSAAFQALRDAEHACWCQACGGWQHHCRCEAPADAARTAAIVAMIARHAGC